MRLRVVSGEWWCGGDVSECVFTTFLLLQLISMTTRVK